MNIYGNNIIDVNSIISTDYRTGFIPEYLYDQNLNPPYRSTTDTVEIVIDLGSAKTWDYIAIGNHNFTSGVSITLAWNSSDSWGAPAGSETITYTAGTIIQALTSTTYRYIKLTIDDTGNTDGYCQMGKLSLGEVVTLPDVEPNFDYPVSYNSTVQRSPTGQVYGSTGVNLRALGFRFLGLSKTELDTLITFLDANQNVNSFYIAVYPDSVSVYPYVHCRITNSEFPWRHEQDGLYTATINLEEVK